MWTNENRGRYDRSRLRYPSDLTDDEWSLVEPLIPPGKRGGDKRTVIMREVVNGLMYILSTVQPTGSIRDRSVAFAPMRWMVCRRTW
jgi:transposase